MIEVNRDGEVWVFAEQEDGRLSEVPLELMGKGRELADKLSVPLAAVLLGAEVKEVCGKLIAYGAEKVYLVEDGPDGRQPDVVRADGRLHRSSDRRPHAPRQR